jgi:hypothetical protein
VLDLRLPDLQQWFVATFGDPEIIQGSLGKGLDPSGTIHHWRKPVAFTDMLPVLMSPEHGGTRTTNIIGLRLRQWGCKALIYPSARNAVGVSYEDGTLTASQGWNLVRYDSSPPPPIIAYKYYMEDPWDSPFVDLFDLQKTNSDSKAGSWMILPVTFPHLLIMNLKYHGQPLNLYWRESLNKMRESFLEFQKQMKDAKQKYEFSFQPAIDKAREEYLHNYATLGPEHLDTLSREDWLSMNDKEWLEKVGLRRQGKREMAEIAHELDTTAQELHQRFEDVQAAGIAIPFTESQLREWLGKIAHSNWRPTDPPPVIAQNEIEELLYWLKQDFEAFLSIGQQLNWLVRVSDGEIRFADSRLFNYFAVPETIKELSSDYQDQRHIIEPAMNRLEHIGAVALPALIEALGNEDMGICNNAATILSLIGPPAVPAVCKALRCTDSKVRQLAARILSRAENANAALPQLLEAAHDEEEAVRFWVFSAIQYSENKDVIPALILMLNDPNKSIAQRAKQTLQAFALPEAQQALKEYQ